MATSHDRGGASLVQELFGVNVQEQGRGFYVALELLAIARGVMLLDPNQLLAPTSGHVTYVRASHDLARRIAVGEELQQEVLASAVQGDAAYETLSALLSSLLVEVPGRRRTPRWFSSHFYPFVGELVHYDAVQRRGAPAIERYVFRDGGGWAYHVLRSDPDGVRRTEARDGLAVLVGDSGTPLGRVAAALQSHDAARPTEFTDLSESESEPRDADSPWPELLRRGVHSIVSRTQVPRAKRTESLMHWVPYCLARHQLHLARRALGEPDAMILLDATHDANPLRRRSQESLDKFRWNIAKALTERAAQHQQAASERGDVDQAERWAKFAQPNANITKSPRAFFSETLAAVGALNSTSGRRHFTFKPPMLEALVAALLAPGEEVEFYRFCQRLHTELGLVVDDRTARSAGLTTDIDAGVFALNAEAFKLRLASAGLLTHYSDATSIIHGEPR
ncbi:hypothetical protein [Cellulomonas terrae]|uniref:Uncharacterized protein n=1 Tax=Cellulomonas terrae TaxID=311234 RepID=A0A511JPF1_9CELL|nr:hypothetical protein [Cellulomonas terrae]GEL99876.1 hypothetical protein CTE05_34230 [Cellulomonas terrae]